MTDPRREPTREPTRQTSRETTQRSNLPPQPEQRQREPVVAHTAGQQRSRAEGREHAHGGWAQPQHDTPPQQRIGDIREHDAGRREHRDYPEDREHPHTREQRTISEGGRIADQIGREAPTARDAPTPAAADTRTIADLLRELGHESRTLVRQEMALARAEMSQKVSVATRNSGWIGAGGIVAHAGALVLAAFLTTALMALLTAVGGVDFWVSIWLAPLIVGAVIAIIGYVMIQKGITTLRREGVMPKRTTASLKETGTWLRDKAK